MDFSRRTGVSLAAKIEVWLTQALHAAHDLLAAVFAVVSNKVVMLSLSHLDFG
jgi:hypothetical protein